MDNDNNNSTSNNSSGNKNDFDTNYQSTFPINKTKFERLKELFLS